MRAFIFSLLLSASLMPPALLLARADPTPAASDSVVATVPAAMPTQVAPDDRTQWWTNFSDERAAMADAHVSTLSELATPCASEGAATTLLDEPFADATSTGQYAPAPLTACCKICTIGIACGNTCISANYSCHVGAGCACNGGSSVFLPPPPISPAISLGSQSPYPRMQMGQAVELSLRVTRLSGPIWFNDDVGLYVTNLDEVAGKLRGWDEQGRIALNHTTGLFASDQQEFKFSVQALAPGVHRLRVGFKHRSSGWFGPDGVYWDVNVDGIAGVSRLFEGWHSQWASQSPYLTMSPGQTAEFWIVFRNVGIETWRRGRWTEQVNLALNHDDKSPFALGMAVDWLWDDRLATTTDIVVAPGQSGRFVFRIRAPLTVGTYRLNLRPVVDGRMWLEDEGVFWTIEVR